MKWKIWWFVEMYYPASGISNKWKNLGSWIQHNL